MIDLDSDPDHSGISNSEDVLNEIDAFLNFQNTNNKSQSSKSKTVSNDDQQQNLVQKISHAPPKDPPIQVGKYNNRNDQVTQDKLDESEIDHKDDDESLSQIEKMDFEFSDSDIADLSFGDDDKSSEKPKSQPSLQNDKTNVQQAQNQTPAIQNDKQNDDNNQIKDEQNIAINQESINEEDIFALSKTSENEDDSKNNSQMNTEHDIEINESQEEDQKEEKQPTDLTHVDNEIVVMNKEVINDRPITKRKSAKPRRRPIQTHDFKSPLNILDDLDILVSEEVSNNDSNSNDEIPPIDDHQEILDNPKTEEKKLVKNEKDENIQSKASVERSAYDRDQSISAKLNTRSINSTVPKTPLEIFESSIVSYLNDLLIDIGISFKNAFQNYLTNYFNLDNIVNPFIAQIKQELGEIINSEAYKLDKSSFTELESDLNLEFDSLSSNRNQNKKGSDDIGALDYYSLINDLNYFQSKYSNDFPATFLQMSKEYNNFNAYADQIFSKINYSDNSITNQLHELEAKDMQISLEKNNINSRMSYIQRLRSEFSEENMFKPKEQDIPNTENITKDLQELVEHLHNSKYKGEIIDKADEMKLLHEEILKLNSRIITKANNISKLLPDLAHSSLNSDETILNDSYHSTFTMPQNEILKEIRIRLMKAKKMREDTIADIQKLDQFDFANQTV